MNWSDGYENLKDTSQRNVLLLFDEVYVKPSLAYMRKVFLEGLLTTLLTLQQPSSASWYALIGCPKLLFKALPVYQRRLKQQQKICKFLQKLKISQETMQQMSKQKSPENDLHPNRRQR